MIAQLRGNPSAQFIHIEPYDTLLAEARCADDL